MDRKYREEHPEESFDSGYHLWAEEKHRERVAKNPTRIRYGWEEQKAVTEKKRRDENGKWIGKKRNPERDERGRWKADSKKVQV